MMRARSGGGDFRGRLRWWLALPAAAAGGLLLDVASPGVGWWPASLIGAVLILAAAWQQRIGVGLLAGAVAGAGFWLPHISWLTLYLGLVPWAGLSALMIAWFALSGIGIAVATRGLALFGRLHERPGVLILAQALAAAGVWVVRESLQGSLPYGGFPWGRLAHMQADGPLAESVSWIGFTGLSGAIAFACALIVAAAAAQFSGGVRLGARRFGTRGRGIRGLRSFATGPSSWSALVGVAILCGLALVPVASLERTGSLKVAAIQGDSKSGIFDDRDSGDVLNDHVEETERLLDELEARDETVDVIVWPENSAEFDLPGNVLGRLAVQKLSERAGAPIVIGSVLRNSDGSYTNSSLVWDADGETGERYDKRYPVPFAEYMPNRSFFHALAPDLVDLVQLEYTAGRRPPVIDVETGSGPVRAGVAICFDIIFDEQSKAMMDSGAEVIFAQTNNADFGHTDESAQQLAIARLRAIETGRSLVNISTVGTSAVVAPDGQDIERLTPFTADSMVADVPLVTGETPATRLGAVISALWQIIGALGIVRGIWSLAVNRRNRRRAAARDAEEPV